MPDDGVIALIARLAKLETAGFSDVLDEMGYPSQVLASDLRPLDAERRLAGIAFCVPAKTASSRRRPHRPNSSSARTSSNGR